MVNINTSTNEFEPAIRTEGNTVPVELLQPTRTLENQSSIPVVEVESSEANQNDNSETQLDNNEQKDIPNNEQKISAGPQVALREIPNDVRLEIMFDKLNGKDIPSIAA